MYFFLVLAGAESNDDTDSTSERAADEEIPDEEVPSQRAIEPVPGCSRQRD